MTRKTPPLGWMADRVSMPAAPFGAQKLEQLIRGFLRERGEG